MVCLLMMDGECADPKGTGASAYLRLGRSDEAVMIGSGQRGLWAGLAEGQNWKPYLRSCHALDLFDIS